MTRLKETLLNTLSLSLFLNTHCIVFLNVLLKTLCSDFMNNALMVFLKRFYFKMYTFTLLIALLVEVLMSTGFTKSPLRNELVATVLRAVYTNLTMESIS